MVRKMLLRERSSMMMCCFLITLIGGMTSGRILTVHTGQAVLLFSNTSVDNNNIVTLYVNGNRKNTLIATWRSKNCSTEVMNMNPNYRERLDMDRNSNIWIWKVGVNDTGRYCINCSQTTTGIAVQLNVLRSTDNCCAEVLTKEEQIQGCLNDLVCLKKYIDSLTGEQILLSLNNLQLDFFKKSFGISHDITTAQSRKADTEDKMMPLLSSSNAVLVLMIISLMFNVVITVVFISHKYACCQCRKRNLIGEQEKPLLKMSRGKKDFGNLKWENIMLLLNDEQKTDLQRYCDKMMQDQKSQLINFDQKQDLSPYRENPLQENSPFRRREKVVNN